MLNQCGIQFALTITPDEDAWIRQQSRYMGGSEYTNPDAVEYIRGKWTAAIAARLRATKPQTP